MADNSLELVANDDMPPELFFNDDIDGERIFENHLWRFIFSYDVCVCETKCT